MDALSQLVDDAERRRRLATIELNESSRGDLGQFMTPAPVAALMASMFGPLAGDIRLLDAGAGVGGLSAAFVAEVCARAHRPRTIAATAFEIDNVLVPHLRRTFDACRRVCSTAEVRFSGRVEQSDFLAAASGALSGPLFADPRWRFDAAILNPPYRKIGAASRERRLVQRAGLDATNLYAAFVALTIRLLTPGGQLVAIIPRSFCNGPYFRGFRELLLTEMSLSRVHVFESRKAAFKEDGILQENVILHARKCASAAKQIVVSSSHGGTEGLRIRSVEVDEVVRRVQSDRFIHIPITTDDACVSGWMARLPGTLASLGLGVSTGRVVDFRAREHLRKSPGRRSVPLIYPCHFAGGRVSWPKQGSRKPNAIARNATTETLLVPAGYYVITKRFSSKEERRRLVAAVYDPLLIEAPVVGFENHVNYFHRHGAGLSRQEAYGLAAFLNSELIDRYFRQFNGHTQVNASDLRSLRYPSSGALEDLGAHELQPGTSELELEIAKRCPMA